MWDTSRDLLEEIHNAHKRLKNKETDAVSAHAEARLLGAATRVLAVSLEHARLTGRLIEGSAELPGMDLMIGVDDVIGVEGRTVPELAEAPAS